LDGADQCDRVLFLFNLCISSDKNLLSIVTSAALIYISLTMYSALELARATYDAENFSVLSTTATTVAEVCSFVFVVDISKRLCSSCLKCYIFNVVHDSSVRSPQCI